MSLKYRLLAAAILVASNSSAQEDKAFDAATAFGARQSVTGMSLSPDGKSVAYVAAIAGPGSAVMTLDLAEGSKPHVALFADGKPDRIATCNWVSNERLVCILYGVVSNGVDLLPFSRVVAVDRSGGNLRLLSTRQNEYSRGYQAGGGRILDWLPDQEGFVLMSRVYLPDDHLGSRLGSARTGPGVDLLDTRNLSVKTVEEPSRENVNYISDGRGTIRIVGRKLKTKPDGQVSGIVGYQYRKQGSREWLDLSEVDEVNGTGFEPLAIDHDLNVAYGIKKQDGRWAVYSVALDGSLTENLIYARPDVDVTSLFRIGRRDRVVGVSYTVDVTQTVYFDPAIEKLMRSLSRALPMQPNLRLVDSSADEQVLLVFAGSDDDPGLYYVFDRASKKLQTFLVARGELEGVKLAKVKPISYQASDGVMIPGYLTLPPGKEGTKGLPAIVLPHGGPSPSPRDYWGFDWLAQYFAARGFAVLQPNFRGSTGYGDAWLLDKGFKSWRIAIGDVLDAGHWLVAQGIADPAKLSVVGWSYGGYAALQSAVTEPGLFKAVVAIAPVTDLETLKEAHRHWTDFQLVSQQIGDGPHVREGSPARNAEKIKVPVLLFHAALDRNVGIGQSRMMAERLTKAGVRNELVTWDYLDHYLEDSAARTQMLRKSDQFLRQAFGGDQ
jgi:dipeptidyl aminopeptidase/acylaminoacyl peptidase